MMSRVMAIDLAKYHKNFTKTDIYDIYTQINCQKCYVDCKYIHFIASVI